MHCGAEAATLDDLREYVPPTREELRAKLGTENAGNRWKPMLHADLVETILAEATRLSLVVQRTAYGMSKDTHSLYGCIDFKNKNPGADHGYALGFRHDNLQRFKLIGVSAARVFVCDNGAIVGDFVFGHKHTQRTELAPTVKEGMVLWANQIARLAEVFDAMKATAIDDRDAEHLMIEGARTHYAEELRTNGKRRVERAPCYAWSQLGKIDLEWNNPRHEAFEPRTLWSLYNAITEVGKRWTPRNVERGLKGWPAMVADEFNLEAIRPQLLSLEAPGVFDK
jgi:hypothetical protein